MRTDPRYGVEIIDNGLIAPGKEWALATLPPADKVPVGTQVYTLDAGLQTSDGVSWGSLGLIPLSTSVADAALNTTNINAALARGGVVSITTPGAILVNDTLLIGNNTSLRLGPNTVLKLANAVNKSIIRNSNHAATPRNATGTISCTASTTELYATIPLTAHGFVAGGFVALAGATDVGWNGTYQVRSVVDANSFTVYLYAVPAATNPTGTVTVTAANGFIEITGGEINANGANQSVSGTTQTFATVLLNVYRPSVHDIHLSRGKKYALCIANSSLIDARNITLDTDSDGIHVQGSCWGCDIQNIKGRANDDFIAFTGGDYNGGSGTGIYTLGIGDFAGIKVRGLYPQNCIYALKLTGNDSHRYHDVMLENVAGVAQHGCVYSNSDTDQTSPRIDSFIARNVRLASLDPANWVNFHFKGPEARKIELEDIWPQHPNQIQVRIDTGCATDVLTINRMHQPVAQTLRMVEVAGTVENLFWNDSRILIGTNGFVVNVTSAGAVTNLTYSKVIMIGNGNAAAKTTYKDGAIATLTYDHCVIDGVHSCFDEGGTPSAKLNVRVYGGRIGTTTAINGQGFNVRTSGGSHFVLDGPELGTFTNNPIQLNATATGTTEIFGYITGRITTKVVNVGAGTVYVHGFGLPADISNLTRRVGAMCFNTNSAANNGTDGAVPQGNYSCDGTASGAWKLLGTTGGANKQY